MVDDVLSSDQVPECNSVRVPKIHAIYGVVGMLKLLAGSYLVVVTESERVGSFLGHPIFKITTLKVLPCDHSLKNSPEEQKKMETEFSKLLSVAEKTTGLYFSYEVNLTLSSQRLHDLGVESKSLPLWRQAEPRFLWNNYMLEVLIDNKLDQFLLPIIQGSFNSFETAIGRDIVDVTLIARRCTRRNGTYLYVLFLLFLPELHRYFLLNEKGDKMKEQLGVVRSNCIDCLDRTNVTQSMIGRKMLELQLKRIGVFGAEETISSHLNFDERYKILWANHGDEISIQYSGTPALKGDFVRYGHRTAHGVVKDGWSSLVRYYLNNFADGTKQDAIDLLQGHYIVAVSRDMAPVPQKGGLEAVANFPVALFVVLISFWFATMSLKQVGSDYKHKHLFFSLLWTGICVGITALVRANGRIFCNRPRLHKPRS
ncbi:PREDICTED: phosphoinositide phosphatase SAC7-like [Camelina sativa]|uniref:Phosphoinositide phosphatase SAC7-like n=1 Tax=Camelina sativa TaxID=90675 RepID=A0ABM1RL21_CAMSA|nr:PREDICTED: phosphoinositide phosphatase SAC7-like [Camelina sativa]